ncbi:MAG: RNA polymerase factor sigma-32 [Desulfuromonadales bacterium]|nr:RNA polymerase factor sigma-32 [Desulfuromonadales bacterium]
MVSNFPVEGDSLSLYLGEIRTFSVMSVEEEHQTAVSFFEDRDLDSAHKLITSNLRFVIKVAYGFRQYGLKMLDLIQEGNIGLMLAVRKYNPYKGVRLISYAVWWIRAYIHNYIISSWSLLKIGTTQAQRKLFFKLREARNVIRHLNSGDDDLHSTAQLLEVSDRDVVEMEQRLQGEFSLDSELPGRDGRTVLDGFADDRMNQEELLSTFQQTNILNKKVAHAVGRLNEKERFIINCRVSADEPMTLQEIADHFLISRERVRQIEVVALKKVRRSLLLALAVPA